jgi:predicted RNase H-like HicB family nuclease
MNEGPLTGSVSPQQSGALSTYISAAMTTAIARPTKTGESYYAIVPGVDAVWGQGNTADDALRDLQRYLEIYIFDAIYHHRALPQINGAALRLFRSRGDAKEVIFDAEPPSDIDPLAILLDSEFA